MALLQIPSINRAKRLAGIHIRRFFTSMTRGSFVKYFLMATRFRMEVKMFITKKPTTREYMPIYFGKNITDTIKITALHA